MEKEFSKRYRDDRKIFRSQIRDDGCRIQNTLDCKESSGGHELRHTTTSKEGKRTYRSSPKSCKDCPCRTCLSFLLFHDGLTALLDAVKANGHEQDCALDDLLYIGVDTGNDKAVAEHADDECAGNGAADGAGAARDADAAEHERGDDVKLEAVTCARLAGVCSRKEDDAGDTREPAYASRNIDVVAYQEGNHICALEPPLALIDQPAAQMGRLAAQQILARIKQPDAPVKNVALSSNLTINAKIPR